MSSDGYNDDTNKEKPSCSSFIFAHLFRKKNKNESPKLSSFLTDPPAGPGPRNHQNPAEPRATNTKDDTSRVVQTDFFLKQNKTFLQFHVTFVENLRLRARLLTEADDVVLRTATFNTELLSLFLAEVGTTSIFFTFTKKKKK